MKISVITATYNSAATIARCLASVHEQSWSDIEHIVIDGASQDNTVEIIKSLPNRVSHLVSEPDRGIYDAINKGIGLAAGDVVGILNSDDVFYDTEAVTKIVNAFRQKKPDCVYGNLVFSNQRGKVVRKWQSQPFEKGLFEKSWTPAHPTFYCKREIYEMLGKYKTGYKIAADVELMLRFLEVHKINSCFLNEILVNMRVGGVSTRGLKSKIIITQEVRRAFNENGLPFNLAKYLFHKTLKIGELNW